jgi:hypothetical protein
MSDRGAAYLPVEISPERIQFFSTRCVIEPETGVRTSPRWWFEFLTLDFLNSVIDSRFRMLFSIEGDHIGRISHINGYSAADNGGENSQPILSARGQGQIDEHGFRLRLTGRLGAYDPNDLGYFGKKHHPSDYVLEIDLPLSDFIRLACEQYSFASQDNVVRAISERNKDVSVDCRPSACIKSTHKFFMHEGLRLTVEEPDITSEYHLPFLDPDFLRRALRYPEFEMDFLAAADDVGRATHKFADAAGDIIEWSQKLSSCRVRGFVKEDGLTLRLTGWFGGPAVSFARQAQRPFRRFAIDFHCNWDDVPALLGYRFLNAKLALNDKGVPD